MYALFILLEIVFGCSCCNTLLKQNSLVNLFHRLLKFNLTGFGHYDFYFDHEQKVYIINKKLSIR